MEGAGNGSCSAVSTGPALAPVVGVAVAARVAGIGSPPTCGVVDPVQPANVASATAHTSHRGFDLCMMIIPFVRSVDGRSEVSAVR